MDLRFDPYSQGHSVLGADLKDRPSVGKMLVANKDWHDVLDRLREAEGRIGELTQQFVATIDAKNGRLKALLLQVTALEDANASLGRSLDHVMKINEELRRSLIVAYEQRQKPAQNKDPHPKDYLFDGKSITPVWPWQANQQQGGEVLAP